MKNHSEVILELLKTRSDLRAVQIADLLDIDLDITQNTLIMLVKDNKVISKPITAPNKMPSVAYSLPATALNWVSPKIPVLGIQSVTPRDIRSELTKPQRALAYLQKHDRVHAKELCEAMGIEHPKYSPTQYLANQIRLGEIIKDGQWYALGKPYAGIPVNKEETELTASVKKSEIPDSADLLTESILSTSHPEVSGEIFNMFSFLEHSLTTDEFLGYLKANVIERTLRGDARGAYEYAGRLIATNT